MMTQSQRRRQKYVNQQRIAIFMGAAVVVALGFFMYQRTKQENMQASYGKQMVQNPNMTVDPEIAERKRMQRLGEPMTQEEALKLAVDIKNAGITVYGQSVCGVTRRQREMFGGRDSQARKVFESSYVECVSGNDCPGIKAVPTWGYGDRKYPGYKTKKEIEKLINEVRQHQKTFMLQSAPEPVSGNLPDSAETERSPALPSAEAVHNSQATLAREKAKKDQAVVQKAYDDAKNEPAPAQPTEQMRGMSTNYPLNTVNMPGTAPMQLPQDRYLQQAVNTNPPRLQQSQSHATPEISRQVQQAMIASVTQTLKKDPNSDSISDSRYPGIGATITTGDPMSNKSVIDANREL